MQVAKEHDGTYRIRSDWYQTQRAHEYSQRLAAIANSVHTQGRENWICLVRSSHATNSMLTRIDDPRK